MTNQWSSITAQNQLGSWKQWHLIGNYLSTNLFNSHDLPWPWSTTNIHQLWSIANHAWEPPWSEATAVSTMWTPNLVSTGRPRGGFRSNVPVHVFSETVLSIMAHYLHQYPSSVQARPPGCHIRDVSPMGNITQGNQPTTAPCGNHCTGAVKSCGTQYRHPNAGEVWVEQRVCE